MADTPNPRKTRGFPILRLAILGPLFALLLLNPVALWNGLIGFPAWAIFSVAYVLEWDESDSPLIQLRDRFIRVYVDYAILEPPVPIKVIDYETANMTVAEILKTYSDNYYHPVVIRGLFKNAPALTRWTDPDYFSNCCGDDEYLTLIDGRWRNMNVTGAKLADVFKQEVMNLREIVEGLKQGKKYYINNLSDIFRKHHELLDDLQLAKSIGPWWGSDNAQYRPIMAQLFMGMGVKEKEATTGSGWHAARHANLFIQVVGNKTWTFLDPKYSLMTCPHVRHHVVAAAADREGMKYEYKWPEREIVLTPGDMLYNPPWQWHMIANAEGFTIGVATRESMHFQNLYNNFMFTALQEFSEGKSAFFTYKRPAAAMLSKVPFLFLTVALVKEAIFGYTPAPADAWTNTCDEHSPVCVKGVTDLHKSAASGGK